MSEEIIQKFVQKLTRCQELPERERLALLKTKGEERCFLAGEPLISSGLTHTHCIIVGEGLLTRQRVLNNEQCQILALYLAGDVVNLQSSPQVSMQDRIVAHCLTQTFWIEFAEISRLIASNPTIADVFWRECLIELEILRAWATNLGKRTSQQKTAHFFAEMACRHEAIGLLHSNTFNLPLRQLDLANTLGLSLVHFNKSTKALRDTGLVEIKGRQITLPERRKLEEFAGFNPSYLCLEPLEVRHSVLQQVAS